MHWGLPPVNWNLLQYVLSKQLITTLHVSQEEAPMFILSSLFLSLSRLCVSKAGAVGSTPGWRTESYITHTEKQKKKTSICSPN